ncbi:MAG TPA: SDR family NAD(P)-dependent oxidoreductase [Ignavibacteriaceae bacterium]|nr:SDR family NAD(P)-dependent oxidoreductase [Ignavibacteriaceae bacterium]
MLKDKIVLITGATSGIGKSCAVAFASEGANLILIARREERLLNLSSSLTEGYKIKVLPIVLDVRNNSEVKKTIGKLTDEWKSIDILINNAGLARGFSKINDGEVEHWEEMIDTNLKGLLYVTRAVSPLMVEREKGHIINIGSTAGHEAYIYGNVYCATKFAVKGLTQAIRIDLLDKNIKVTTVDPGMVVTEFAKVRFSGDEERAAKVYEGVNPLGPDDVAQAVLFAATRPAHVNINEIIITPTQQASSTQVHRKK